MRYYRDIEPKETLQAGDERFRGGNDWAAVGAELFGLTPNDLPWGLFRRPVDLPVLQPVTAEAMAELERREKTMIVHISDYDARHLSHGVNGWWEEPAGRRTPRPPSGWFVELATLKGEAR